ncbi:MAG: 50S ribosomal protein L23 [Candidatus Makana argininalis]
MIYLSRIFKIFLHPIVSEKSSIYIKKNNTIVLKVIKNTTKKEIKYAIYKLFKIKVKNIRTLIMKGKTKFYKKRIGYRSNWKKAYITIKKNQKLNFKNIKIKA